MEFIFEDQSKIFTKVFVKILINLTLLFSLVIAYLICFQLDTVGFKLLRGFINSVHLNRMHQVVYKEF